MSCQLLRPLSEENILWIHFITSFTFNKGLTGDRRLKNLIKFVLDHNFNVLGERRGLIKFRRADISKLKKFEDCVDASKNRFREHI